MAQKQWEMVGAAEFEPATLPCEGSEPIYYCSFVLLL